MSDSGARESNVSTVLGFDYGEKRIGIAIGQTLTGTARALETVRVVSKQPDWRAIAKLVDRWRPDAFVVGLPLNMDGTEQAMTAKAARFGRQLEGRFSLPVHTCDERLSTREAWQRMLEAPNDRAGVDAFAAEVVLEGWLSTRDRGTQ